MMRWEYTVVYAPPGAGPTAITDLKEAGLEGWKLVSVINGWCYLMRPIVEEEERPAEKMLAMLAAKKPAKPAARKRRAKK